MRNTLAALALVAWSGCAFAQQYYVVTDIGTLGLDTYGSGINNSGQVTGYSVLPGNTATHAFMYTNGSMQDIGTLGGIYSESEGVANTSTMAYSPKRW